MTGRLLVNPNFDGCLVLFARYRMADERRALWLLEQTNPDDDWTGRSLGQQPIFPLPRPDRGAGPGLDGESRQLLVYPVMNTSLHWLRQARPSGEVWPKQKNGIVSMPGCGRLRDERAPGLALLRPCRAIGGGVVTASTRFDAGARETTPPPGPAASTATRVRAARGVVVVTAWSR